MLNLLSLAGNWRAWAALGVVVLGAALYVQTLRLGSCQADLRGARDKLALLGAQIEAQNAAVASLELDAKRRTAEASLAAQAARRQAEGLRAQSRGLQRALEDASAHPELTQASPCPAGDAVQEVRRALAR